MCFCIYCDACYPCNNPGCTNSVCKKCEDPREDIENPKDEEDDE